MLEAILGVTLFSTIVLFLALCVLIARRLLVPQGVCDIEINTRKKITANIGDRLLAACLDAGILLPSACGGAGTCGLCKARVLSGGGVAGAQELALLNRREARSGVRLSCQVSVSGPLAIEVDEALFDIKTWRCVVEESRNVSTLIREIVLSLPQGERLDFRAGGFVQVNCPAFRVAFSDFDIEPQFRDIWDRYQLWDLNASSDTVVSRAYSMANHPVEQGRIILNVRIALPPPGQPQAPPGMVSSWLFSLKPGDSIEISGPYGHFYVEPDECEAVFIGGGAGMAPLRAQILDLLETQKTNRKLSYWYGARSRRELYYGEIFETLAQEHANFDWHPALSEAESDDAWDGYQGYIHEVVFEHYLRQHATPERCDYYLCGPPLMVQSVLAMLDELGVAAENIHFDDFGS